MPQPWVAGPTTLLFNGVEFGTAERFPRFLIRSGFLPYFNDISGPVIPNDILWAGKEAFAFADMNRWDEGAMDIARALPYSGSADFGSWADNDVGTMMIHEKKARPLTLLFPYASKGAYAGMPRGYVFPAAWMEGPEEFGTLGTTPQKFHAVFHALAFKQGKRWILARKL